MLESFLERLEKAWETSRSLLCVGLDPDPRRLPVRDVAEFNAAVVEATADLACAYKPNLAFYEALGLEGLRALERTVERIRRTAPHAVVIGDGKRGDVANSSAAYARAMFDGWGFDAVTVNVFGGADSVAPFLERRGKGVFVWCRSSNPGAGEFQDLPVGEDGQPLYLWLAHRVSQWQGEADIGLVVGATYPRQLVSVRRACPTSVLLVPGVGAQGGALSEALRAGMDAQGRGLLINSSRGILYASSDRREFAGAARRAAASLREAMARTLEQEGKGWR